MFNFTQSKLRIGAWLVVILAIACSLLFGAERIRTEHNYRQVNIIVNETDIRSFANANKKNIEEMLKTFKLHGVSQVLFKEISLADLEKEGKIGIYQGENVFDAREPEKLPKFKVNDASRYVVVYDNSWCGKIEKELAVKVRNSNVFKDKNNGHTVIEIPTMIAQTPQETQASKQVVDAIGVGFDDQMMAAVAEAGLGVIPQIRAWKATNDESWKQLKKDIQQVPNLAMVMMNDKIVPGYPDELDKMTAILRDEKNRVIAPLGIVEFANQKGIERLGLSLDKEVVRVHTISNGEMSLFEGDTEKEREKGEKEALDRWRLAAKERNMRALLVRFFDIAEPAYSLQYNLAYLDHLKQTLEKDGFSLDKAYGKLSVNAFSPWFKVIVGLGVAAGLFLLMDLLMLPKLGLLSAILLALGWLGVFRLSPIFAAKVMALLAVIIFPTYACIRFLSAQSRPLPHAVWQLLRMSMISLIGAVLLVGLLSEPLFMLKLDQFIGVKIAHMVPLLIVPLALYIWLNDNPGEALRVIFRKTVDYRWALIFGLLAIALMIYLNRTGNSGVHVSDWEMTVRQWLTDIMGVRPRSKEFLIGYPLTLVYLVFAKERRAFWVLTIPAVIGQVSLVNTYAHVHTPLLASLARSANGLVLGLVIGCLLVGFICLCRRLQLYLTRTLKGGRAK